MEDMDRPWGSILVAHQEAALVVISMVVVVVVVIVMVAVMVEIDTIVDDAVQVPHDGTVVVVEAVKDMMAEEVVEVR
jgi:hypothetical protein